MHGNKARGLQYLREAGFLGLPFLSLSAEEILAGTNLYLPDLAQTLGHPDLYAVRSSSATEDTEEHAAAGAFKTLLGLRLQDLSSACLEVAKSLPSTGSDHGVIVQAFLAQPVASGVLFTHPERYLVNLAPGLCTYVVQGHPVEEIGCHPSGRIYRRQTPQNLSGWTWKDDGLTELQASHSAYTPALAKALQRLYRRIQKSYGRPMDIEWSYADGKIYVLQARPVTREWHQEPWLLDNSNLAESYAGTVQPMTSSVAQRLYRHVYEDLLAASGVPRRKLVEHAAIFSQLVTAYHGRMYYVMNHWYAMMAFLPGYGRNKENLERMISAQTHAQPFLPESLQPDLGLRWSYVPRVVWKLATFSRIRRRFTARVQGDFDALGQRDWPKDDLQSLRTLWKDLETRWLRQWYITVENDTALMTLLGWAQKRFSEDQLRSFLTMDTPSGQQLRDFQDHAHAFWADPHLRAALEAEDQEAFNARLAQWPDHGAGWQQYFHRFGGRFPNELRLEDASPLDDFSLLAQSIRALAAQPQHPAPSEVPEIGFPWGIRKLRQFIQQRESLRLLRSSAFGWLRKILLESGHRHAELGHLLAPEDVFWLQIDEWENGEPSDWKPRIAARKMEAARHAEDVYPRAFAAMPGEPAPLYRPELEAGDAWEGHCVVPGRLEGRVLVMPTFQPGPYPAFDILVAKHTDPGWSFLIGQARGLIVEQGGLLSHASIVARELGVPTLIGVPNITQHLHTGELVVLDSTQRRLHRLDSSHP